MATGHACPCGQDVGYAECCRPLHKGKRKAATPGELMRSRYTAYVKGEVEYLMRTLHPQKHHPQLRQELTSSVKDVRWEGLTVVSTTGGSLLETTGTVTFQARYVAGAETGLMRECSRFERVNGDWLYVDGVVEQA